jgi:prepilin-type processing-associated H-X9-DG protein
MICVIAIIAILAALLLPGIARARDRARQTQCAGQLKQIGISFHSFAHDHNSLFPMQVPVANGGSMEYVRAGVDSNSFAFRHFQALGRELVTPRVLVCPTDARLPAPGFAGLSNQNVSFFVAVNADYGRPASLLAGDRNLTNDWTAPLPVQRLGPNYRLRWSHELHRFRGNLLFVDAHVEQLADSGLTALAASGGGTYVLNMPATPTAARSGGSTGTYPPPATLPRSPAPEADRDPSTFPSEGGPDSPIPGKEQELAGSKVPALSLQKPGVISMEVSSRPAAASDLAAAGSSTHQKPSAGKFEGVTNPVSLLETETRAVPAARSAIKEKRGFFADIVDISMKFLWFYYLGLVLLALLALLLRKHFLPAQEQPPRKQT